ncbi:hypothetical protein [Rhizobium sp.]|jgi:Kdo2-lipid IVA lauroyltransferase/acyltransferase|uniref:lysophospholipid acyltransferase family protein n=1 Tax=Rhizobium sp. TaxID=391 RepID=UPI000E9DC0AE|nr:hypothetical protein [Rhizobium sp.]
MKSFTQRATEVWEKAAYNLMRKLPVDMASDLGSLLVRTNVKYNRPEIIAGAKRNLALHRPEWSDKDINAGVQTFLDNVGRFMGEFAALPRVASLGRASVEGVDNILPYFGKRPLLALPLHISNWEASGACLQTVGLKFASFYDPPKSEIQRQIAIDTRETLGFQLLTPDRKGLQEAMRLLGENKAVAIFPDEARQGRAMAPLFGRAPHTKGNLAVAAKLARKFNCAISVTYIERKEKCRFVMHWLPVHEMPDASQSTPLSDVAFLNQLIEPVIKANIESWYFLDDAIEPIT